MPQNSAPSFKPLTGIYEPSAIQQLPDGRFLVVEDEKSNPLSTFSIAPDGSVASNAVRPGLLQMFSSFWDLEDLEGLALGRSGFVYAITSHSRDERGHEKGTRERLVRFRIDGDRVIEPKIVSGLKKAMTARFPALAAAAEVREVKDDGGLNVEALEITADEQRLLIGLRSPLVNGRAIIVSVENPAEVFDTNAEPRLAETLTELDLAGQGIRGMCFVPALGGYLIIGGPASKAGAASRPWLWSGESGARPRPLTGAGLADLKNAEGISPAVIDKQQRLIVVSDDGDRKARRCANYLVLDPAQLSIPA